MLSALKSMKYDAVGIGRNELILGVEKLKPLFEKNGIPMVNSNLIIKSTGQPLGEPYVVLKAGSLSVAVFSVLPQGIAEYDPQLVEDLIVIDPAVAVSDLLSKLKDKVDVTILLADLNMESSQKLVSNLPGIDIVISNEISKKALTPGAENSKRATILPGCHKGTSLGKLQLLLEPNEKATVSENEMIELDDEVLDDPDMNAIISAAYADRAEERKRKRELLQIEEFKKYRDMSPMEYLEKINEQ